MRLSTGLVALACALQAMSMAIPQSQPFAREMEERSVISSLAGAGEKAVATTLGDSLKGGLLSGLGSLVGGTAIGSLLGGDKNNKREILEYIQARADEELAARSVISSLAGAGEKAAASTLGDALKGGLLSGLGSLVGGEAISKLTSRDIDELVERDPKGLATALKGGLLSGLGSLVGGTAISSILGREIDELAARDPAGLGSALKGGLLSGLGSLVGGTAIGSLLSREESDELVARSFDELAARDPAGLGGALKGGLLSGLGSLIGGTAIGSLISREEADELVARSVISSLAGAGEKAAAATLGSSLKGGLLSGLGSLIGGSAISALLPSGNDKREFDEFVARSVISSLAGDAEKVAATTLGDSLKGGLLSGLGSLVGGSAIGALLPSGNNKREFDELVSRSVISSLAGAGEKAVATTLGDSLKGGLLSGLGSLVGGSAISALLPSGSKQQRDFEDLVVRSVLSDDEFTAHLSELIPTFDVDHVKRQGTTGDTLTLPALLDAIKSALHFKRQGTTGDTLTFSALIEALKSAF